MRKAETVLGSIRERGRRGLPLERVSRLLWNRDLFLLAYGRIAKNDGALTPGITQETADGMNLAKIDILEAYYEPQFSARSHGFRRGRACHTVLSERHRT